MEKQTEKQTEKQSKKHWLNYYQLYKEQKGNYDLLDQKVKALEKTIQDKENLLHLKDQEISLLREQIQNLIAVTSRSTSLVYRPPGRPRKDEGADQDKTTTEPNSAPAPSNKFFPLETPSTCPFCYKPTSVIELQDNYDVCYECDHKPCPKCGKEAGAHMLAATGGICRECNDALQQLDEP